MISAPRRSQTLAASMAARISRERLRYVLPSAVSASRRVVRLISRTPRRCSNRKMSFETAEGERPTSSAAAAKLPRSATRLEYAHFIGSIGH